MCNRPIRMYVRKERMTVKEREFLFSFSPFFAKTVSLWRSGRRKAIPMYICKFYSELLVCIVEKFSVNEKKLCKEKYSERRKVLSIDRIQYKKAQAPFINSFLHKNN